MIHQITCRWVDIDSYGHVNNARYFDYMTEARAIALLEKFTTLPKHLQFILVDTHCNFNQPIFYPATVYIKQQVTHIGTSSFKLSYEFFTDPELSCKHATGSAKMVCFNSLTSTAQPLDSDIISQLETLAS